MHSVEPIYILSNCEFAFQLRWGLTIFWHTAVDENMSIGCSFQETPSDVVLSLMNNIAWVHDMKPVLCYSAFMGTFGEYDQRSVAGHRLK